MGNNRRVSITAPEALDDWIESVNVELTREFPEADTSKSMVWRELAMIGALALSEESRGDLDVAADGGDLLLPELDPRDVLPSHVLTELRRERIKSENREADLAGGWSGRISDAFAERFAAGYKPEDMETLAAGYLEEARLYWGEEEERLAWARRYLEALLDEYREAYHDGRDVLDPRDTFESFTGVEEGREQDRVPPQEIVGEARKLLRNAKKPSNPAIIKKLEKEFLVDTEYAETAVETARAIEYHDHEESDLLGELEEGRTPDLPELDGSLDN